MSTCFHESNATLPTLDADTTNRNLRLLTSEGGAYSVMVGVGETYLAALVIAIGLGDHLAGFITTVPVFGGACLQLVSFWGVRRFKSNRNWSAFAATVQAISAATFSIGVLFGYATATTLFLAATLYWFGGLAAGASWNSWVEHLVPIDRRATFFGSRATVCQICVLLGILLGGGLLRAFESVHIFSLLFAIAATCRLVSAISIACGTELPQWRPKCDEGTTLISTLNSLAPETKTFLGYLLAMQVAVFIASPFYTPYMLRHLGLDYVQYTWLIALGFVGKILAMPFAGRVASRYGAVRTLWIGGLGIAPMAGIWAFSDSLAFLSLAQVAGGVLWAFYELATVLLFFEKITLRQRVAALSAYNLGNAAAMVLGSILGSLLLKSMGATVSAYLVVFLVSSVARLAPLFLIPKRSEATTFLRRLVPPMRLIAVRPQAGVWMRPVVFRNLIAASTKETEDELPAASDRVTVLDEAQGHSVEAVEPVTA